jgi:hypothetical protein
MINPWLNVPLTDYEAHMASGAVDQADALSALFAEVLALCRPASVAVLGVAGGNGLERIDPACTQRVVGIDLNPDYLLAVRSRFADLAGLELHHADLSVDRTAIAPVDLVHAALIFEHAGTALCLQNALALVAPSGALSVVLQVPGETSGNVGSSGIASVSQLASHFALVEPAELTARIATSGFALIHQARRTVPAGKQLWHGVFTRS